MFNYDVLLSNRSRNISNVVFYGDCYHRNQYTCISKYLFTTVHICLPFHSKLPLSFLFVWSISRLFLYLMGGLVLRYFSINYLSCKHPRSLAFVPFLCSFLWYSDSPLLSLSICLSLFLSPPLCLSLSMGFFQS